MPKGLKGGAAYQAGKPRGGSKKSSAPTVTKNPGGGSSHHSYQYGQPSSTPAAGGPDLGASLPLKNG